MTVFFTVRSYKTKMPGSSLPEYLVIASNTGHGLDNKIHDDEIAQKFGFTGALVPGVDVYAYMAHAPVLHWGRKWLEHGYMHVRLAKPVYEDDKTYVTGSLGSKGRMFVEANARGEICGVGEAMLEAPRAASQTKIEKTFMPEADQRSAASQFTLSTNTVLGARDDEPAASGHDDYLASVHESLGIYRDQGLVHPGYILRRANLILRENVVLGPWIHVESWIWNLRALGVDEPFTTRAVVTDNFDRKGHLFVDLDVLVAARDTEPITRVSHRSIYVPRQLRENVSLDDR